MPIYEYRCPNGHTFEVFQRMSDDPVETCETCGAAPVEKVLFPVAVHFKGSGFYSTDYGKSKKQGSGGKEADSSTASSEKSATKEGGSESGGKDSEKGSSSGDKKTKSDD
jgi:putative FmdB family regulatory protein